MGDPDQTLGAESLVGQECLGSSTPTMHIGREQPREGCSGSKALLILGGSKVLRHQLSATAGSLLKGD